MRDYMDRRVTSPTWGPPPPCKQALIHYVSNVSNAIYAQSAVCINEAEYHQKNYGDRGRNFGLTQLIDKSTRSTEESSTLLDLFASNSPGNITFTNVVASSLSGHDMLIAVRKINACKLPTSTIEWRNYAKYNPSAFCDDLRDIPWDDVLKERNVNTAWSNWKELFLNVCDRHAPYKRKIV
ncbi:unnamed protein product [Porites lobata]|uniref:Uncharacterized protein n=1 Tax=Porites lobata TaxID=104759 RepID=A0ABN8R535_9CNID|nr:unnamed protein product [Porites lobata]